MQSNLLPVINSRFCVCVCLCTLGLLRATRTSPPPRPRWPTRSRCRACRSCPRPTTSTSTSTNLASELSSVPVQDPTPKLTKETSQHSTIIPLVSIQSVFRLQLHQEKPLSRFPPPDHINIKMTRRANLISNSRCI